MIGRDALKHKHKILSMQSKALFIYIIVTSAIYGGNGLGEVD